MLYFLFDFRVTVSNFCVEFDSRFTLFKWFWFSISIWIMVVFDLLSSTRFLFCFWKSSINFLFRCCSDWLWISVKNLFIRWNCYFTNILIASISVVMFWISRLNVCMAFSVALIIVTSNSLLGHLLDKDVSRELGARVWFCMS